MASSKAWPLRYMLAKVQRFTEEAAAQLSSTSTTIPQALAKGLEAYRQQLTTVVFLTGSAMLPTLQGNTSLLTRLHPKIYAGDVVAFNSPLSGPADQQNVLVRRVAAVEGDEMVTDDADEQGFRIPEGHCWVLPDNEQLRHTEVIDSRTFGPLPISHILGRAMYYSSSSTDHGELDNSAEAKTADKPVLEVELDLDKLCDSNSK